MYFQGKMACVWSVSLGSQQGKAGMEKSLIVLAGGVQVLNQAQQRRTVEVGKLALEIGPGRFFLARFFHGTHYLLLIARKAESSARCR